MTTAGNTPPEAAELQLTLRNSRPEDYPGIRDIMDKVYPDLGGAWTQAEYGRQLERFPEGQICIVDEGGEQQRVVAAAISLIVSYAEHGDSHNYASITGGGGIKAHDADGDTLYGVDVFVDPEYRSLRLGRRLYDARKELCESLNLKRIIIGARIPGYDEYRDSMSPRQYIDKVQDREIRDPILSFQLANGFRVRKLVRNYLPEDEKSGTCAVVLEWTNIFHDGEEKLINRRRTTVRVGAIQWQMRPQHSVDELIEQVEYFVGAVGGYKADIVLLPEFFNAPLMGLDKSRNAAQAIRLLADFTDEICERIQGLAVTHNVNIVAGSMPEYSGEHLYNVSHLFHRDGRRDRQYKLHITPDERDYWGLKGGETLQAFDTDIGRIGILICYDVEFPELPRHLADQGIDILFVPYWTDNRSGYLRVRHCAQARAVENECYVVITGSMGNLPNVPNMDIQYSQSAVLSPADFAFPHDAVVDEATPNTEMLLLSDLNLDLLRELRNSGSVRNRRDRRRDLYHINWLGSESAR